MMWDAAEDYTSDKWYKRILREKLTQEETTYQVAVVELKASLRHVNLCLMDNTGI
jgi:hypothetical protein